MTYYVGDLDFQKRMLAQQIYHMPQAMQEQAVKLLYNRVLKHFGLKNKYDGKGNLRANKKK